MEGKLLYYLAARISVHPIQDWAMATLISPWVAVTTAHAVPRGPQSEEGKHVFWLDCPHIEERHEVRVSVEAEDPDVDFAVLKLEEPLELPTEQLALRVEPVREGALWETLCIGPSVDEAIPVHGRVEGIEIVGERSLIKLLVYNSPPDPQSVSGAPVMVDDKVIGILWGIHEPEPKEPSKAGRSKARRSSKEPPREYWYAVPVSAMIESKKTDAIRNLLDQNQRSTQTASASSDDPGALPASGGYSVSEIRARLQDVNSDVRAAAIQALRAQVSTDPEVKAAVMKLLADQNSNVRAAAVSALGQIVDPDATIKGGMLLLLQDKNSDVRAEAVKALSAVASDDTIKAALTARLEDENSNVRAAAVTALGAAGPDTQASSAGAAATPASPPLSSDRQQVQDIAETDPETSELDPELFFRRLSSSARRALSHAAGMRRYLTALFSAEINQKMGLQQHENEQLEHTPESIPLAYLIAGLFENEDGPTRRLFLSKELDAVKVATLVQQSDGIPVPSRAEYSPFKLEKLPWMTPQTQLALQAARYRRQNGCASDSEPPPSVRRVVDQGQQARLSAL